MIIYHLQELKFRLFYLTLSLLLSSLITFTYLPTLMAYSPIVFLNYSWEDALFSFITLSILIAFVISFPLFIFHLYSYFISALYPKELDKFLPFLLYTATFLFIYWLSTPWIIFTLPSFFLTFHTDTILLTPLLKNFTDLVIDYFICSIIILFYPLLIFNKVSRKYLYLCALLLSSIFGETLTLILVLIPQIIYIEISYIIMIFTIKYQNYKYLIPKL